MFLYSVGITSFLLMYGTSHLLFISKEAPSVFEKDAMKILNEISLMGNIPGRKNRPRQTMRRLYGISVTHILP